MGKKRKFSLNKYRRLNEMTKEELIKKLFDLTCYYDLEKAHIEADILLLEYINDEEITKAFNDIDKWYA